MPPTGEAGLGPASDVVPYAHAPGGRLERARLAVATLRAGQWWHFVLVPAIPLHLSFVSSPGEALLRYVPAAIAASLALAYAYGLNAITDRHHDALEGKNPIAGYTEVPRAGFALVVASAAAALATGTLCADVRVLPVAISLAGGTLYSAGPRVKRWPVLSTISNCWIFTPLAFFVAPQGGDAPAFATLVIAYVGLQTQTQLVHEIADLEEDRRGGIRTTAVAFGARRTALAAMTLGGALAVALLAMGPLDAATVLAATSLVAGGALIARAPAARAARTRHLHRKLSMAFAAAIFLAAATRA